MRSAGWLAWLWLVCATPALAQGDAWRELRSESEGFAVALPGSPAESRTSHWTALGPVHVRAWESVHGEGSLRIEAHQLPRLARSLLSDDALLRRAAGGLVEDVGGSERENLAARVSGWPARSVRWSAGERGGAARLVLSERRLYVLIAEQTDPAAAERFFASLEIW